MAEHVKNDMSTLGRGAACDPRVLLPDVSPHHATVTVHANPTVVRNVGSGTTLVNGAPVSVHALQHGDELALGARRLSWESDVPQEPRRTNSQPSLAVAVARWWRGRAHNRAHNRDVQLALEQRPCASVSAAISGSGGKRLLMAPHRPCRAPAPALAPAPAPAHTSSNHSAALHTPTKATLLIENRRGRARSAIPRAVPPQRLPVLRKALTPALRATELKDTKIQAPHDIGHMKEAAIMLMARHPSAARAPAPCPPATRAPAPRPAAARAPAPRPPAARAHAPRPPAARALAPGPPATRAPAPRPPAARAPAPGPPAARAPASRPPAARALAPRPPATCAPAPRPPAARVPAPRPPATRAPLPPGTRAPAPRPPATRAPAPRPLATRAPAPRPPATRAPAPRPPATRAPAPRPPAARAPHAPELPTPATPHTLLHTPDHSAQKGNTRNSTKRLVSILEMTDSETPRRSLGLPSPRNTDSEDSDLKLRYSRSLSPSPRYSRHSRSSRLRESVGPPVRSRSETAESPASPRSLETNETFAIELDQSSPRSSSQRRDLEAYSAVDLVSLDSDTSRSVSGSAGSPSRSALPGCSTPRAAPTTPDNAPRPPFRCMRQDIRGALQLLRTYRARRSSKNQSGKPGDDLAYVRDARELFQRGMDGLNASGVTWLDEPTSADAMFDRLVGKPPVRASYSTTFIVTSPSVSLDNLLNNLVELLQGCLGSNCTRALQQLATDTVAGASLVLPGRTPSSTARSYADHTLPIKEFSLESAPQPCSAQEHNLLLKKRMLVHSSPVKGLSLVALSMVAPVSPIACEPYSPMSEPLRRTPISRNSPKKSENVEEKNGNVTPSPQKTRARRTEVANDTPATRHWTVLRVTRARFLARQARLLARQARLAKQAGRPKPVDTAAASPKVTRGRKILKSPVKSPAPAVEKASAGRKRAQATKSNPPIISPAKSPGRGTDAAAGDAPLPKRTRGRKAPNTHKTATPVPEEAEPKRGRRAPPTPKQKAPTPKRKAEPPATPESKRKKTGSRKRAQETTPNKRPKRVGRLSLVLSKHSPILKPQPAARAKRTKNPSRESCKKSPGRGTDAAAGDALVPKRTRGRKAPNTHKTATPVPEEEEPKRGRRAPPTPKQKAPTPPKQKAPTPKRKAKPPATPESKRKKTAEVSKRGRKAAVTPETKKKGAKAVETPAKNQAKAATPAKKRAVIVAPTPDPTGRKTASGRGRGRGASAQLLATLETAPKQAAEPKGKRAAAQEAGDSAPRRRAARLRQ